MLATAWFNVGGIAAPALLSFLTVEVLGGSDAAFGLVLASGAAGALVGAAVTTRLVALAGRRRALVGAAAMSAAATFGVAAAPSPPVLALLWFLGGMPVGVLLPVLRALQQRLTPNRLLGRVNTTGRVVTRGMMVVGSLGAGLLAEATSTRVAIAAGAAVQLSAAGLLWVVLRSRDLDTAPPDPTR